MRGDPDPAIFPREIHGVIEEVGKYLPESNLVSFDGNRIGGKLQGYLTFAAVHEGAAGFNRLVNNVANVHRLQVEL